ncbi:hypothetical protein DLP05_053 [Stenotrophomonas phage vB_SmaS_DLP_5]|uniref:Uncharacterized protein n=1 Tax=Stenotrophomonas phage vB_SmaS_DLP_5 TaxID=2044561 RepID=A0A2D2W2M9_9CAUD|nr:hypothetical protein FDJ07_gp052 [Stenotrophomonas phage vB_SmaS_DLP_5]ATS92329.1 hypothetical protein DLP05_053 [Stenotrophomonas phage vB_SmaS_DLP_5]
MNDTVKLKKVIDPVRHARLLAGIDQFAATAGIPPHFIHKSTREHLSDKEIQWLRDYPEHKQEAEGLLLTGIHDPDPATKMQSMTAAFLRNFIDARLMAVNQILDLIEQHSMPEPEVLLIPNLFQSAYGKAFPAYKVQQLYDLLLGRVAKGKLTVVYVQNMDELEAEFGVLFRGHLNTYEVSKGKKA